MRAKNPYDGSFDKHREAERLLSEAAGALSIKRILAWQLEAAMEEQHISKSEMARRMATSRPQLERLLDPDNESVTLDTLMKAAAAVGRKVRLELV